MRFLVSISFYFICIRLSQHVRPPIVTVTGWACDLPKAKKIFELYFSNGPFEVYNSIFKRTFYFTTKHEFSTFTPIS